MTLTYGISLYCVTHIGMSLDFGTGAAARAMPNFF